MSNYLAALLRRCKKWENHYDRLCIMGDWNVITHLITHAILDAKNGAELYVDTVRELKDVHIEFKCADLFRTWKHIVYHCISCLNV
jgi:exonuclease III